MQTKSFLMQILPTSRSWSCSVIFTLLSNTDHSLHTNEYFVIIMLRSRGTIYLSVCTFVCVLSTLILMIVSAITSRSVRLSSSYQYAITNSGIKAPRKYLFITEIKHACLGNLRAFWNISTERTLDTDHRHRTSIADQTDTSQQNRTQHSTMYHHLLRLQ